MTRWVLIFVLGCVGAIAAALLIVWATNGFAAMDLSVNGLIALTLGMVLTTALAVGLMALVFYSNRGEGDRAAHEAGRDRAERPPR